MKFEDDNLTSWTTKGGFLVSGDNVMTASWGFIGVMWGKKVAIVPVRDSRYTKEFMDKTGEFTFSVPALGELTKELGICGSKSGRDVNKWELTGLQKLPAKAVATSVVGGCAKYFECKVLTVLDMDKLNLADFAPWYPTGDKHNFYFGEVVAEY